MLKIKPLHLRYIVIGALILSNILLIVYARAISKKQEDVQVIKNEIDSIKKTIKSNEQIYQSIIHHPVYTGEQADSIVTEYETKTGLSGFRDSIERALSKKHFDK